MPEKPILAATHWNSNADLIADIAKLGYLKKTDLTLDPTYGRGTWWKKWQPDTLITHDIAIDGVDFCDLPYPAGHFQAVAFDPPYVSVGGRVTTTIPDMHNRYGLTDAPTSPARMQAVINDGIAEMYRVLAPKGILLVKSQDYISSGKLWLGTHWTLSRALEVGFFCVDRLEHISAPRPQPPRSRQVHARRNLSTMFVLRR